MKFRIYTFLSILILGTAVVFSACNKDDDDDNKPTPLSCDRTIEGSVTLGQSDYTIDMKITGSGTYSISKIEYKDADGNLQTLNNPDLPWEESFTLSGPSGTVFSYQLTMYTSVTNGKITASFVGEDDTQYTSSSRECSQYTE